MPRVWMVVFEGAQSLDVTGPTEVFAAAMRAMRAQDEADSPSRARASLSDPYVVELLSVGGGERTTSSGVVVGTRDLRRVRLHAGDTVLVAGGEDDAVRRAMEDADLLAFLRRAERTVRRLGSVCSGAFVLAAAGLLDGHRAATHWLGCDALARAFPRVRVERQAIFVHEGPLWTSAGVTTGIDMALAMVEEDCGRALADAVAARLVLYMRRPGYQSQFSDALVAQTSDSDPLAPALSWARANLRTADVEGVARKAGLSLRTFHRRCLQHLSTTPAKLLDRLRVEQARTLLSTTALPAKALAARCGFASATCMKRAFRRELGVGPREYRLLFARGEAS